MGNKKESNRSIKYFGLLENNDTERAKYYVYFTSFSCKLSITDNYKRIKDFFKISQIIFTDKKSGKPIPAFPPHKNCRLCANQADRPSDFHSAQSAQGGAAASRLNNQWKSPAVSIQSTSATGRFTELPFPKYSN